MHKLHVCILEAFYPVNEDDVKTGGTKVHGGRGGRVVAANREFCKVKCRSAKCHGALVDRMQRFPALTFPVLSASELYKQRRGLEAFFSFKFSSIGLFYHFCRGWILRLFRGSNFSRLNVTFSTIS